jgi:hypothetical protein
MVRNFVKGSGVFILLPHSPPAAAHNFNMKFHPQAARGTAQYVWRKEKQSKEEVKQVTSSKIRTVIIYYEMYGGNNQAP